ncbi:P-loop containing nucleoside triphosphate hydrolase protein [Cercophora newfieldiana]|uniref:P-loop containing nucleoside triphosphate hydrolase protein n=1 Tax=Cercophora newfieldiana TaxID=92897 RepID=A0AA39XYX8_9PEZI|nr:P-loop containing nucleoside triphosphate hydrolase protein [Cercophora newfieldiana]
MVALQNDPLSQLCSADQLKLLDSIDRLRLQGINNYVSLPQIIVCGDQSSGKSSVLEAISGVSFPVKSNLCTRFPTELVLRRAQNISASVSIVPHESRNESESQALRGFQETLKGFDDLPNVIESAKLAMGITTHGRAFSRDILRVEITGPDRPHLTIVDLPGVIHSQTKHQTSSDVELIQDVVQGYMKEARCVILAVIQASNDYANQIVLKLARAADKSGTRTLGVITKPDTLVPGSPREAEYISLARNQEIEFRLGWHVLKNMDSDKGSSTLAQRDAEEMEFFSKGGWTELPQSSLGVEKLRSRLSTVLLRQIASKLEGLMDEIDAKFSACQEQLVKLGKPRASLDEQRLYMFDLSQSFQTLVAAASSGTYNDAFFVDAKTPRGYQQRVRAVVHNLNGEFSSGMLRNGHYREIVDAVAETPDGVDGSPSKMLQADFLDHIEELMRRTRGRELPGTFNPMIVADLFLEQSQPWEQITEKHVKEVWGAANIFLRLVAEHIADPSTSRALDQEIFEPTMKDLLQQLQDKTAEFLAPHKSGHPITYNHYFTETLQSVRRERIRKATVDTVKAFFGCQEGDMSRASTPSSYYNLERLVSSLVACNEPDMNRFAAQEALDCLNAYYKVALKRFIDDIAVQVIEEKLVSQLHHILSPVSIYKMPNDQITRIAGESEENKSMREQLSRQLSVLRNGLETCKHFSGLKFSSGTSTSSPEPEVTFALTTTL